MKREGLAESEVRSKVQAMVDESLEVSSDRPFLHLDWPSFWKRLQRI